MTFEGAGLHLEVVQFFLLGDIGTKYVYTSCRMNDERCVCSMRVSLLLRCWRSERLFARCWFSPFGVLSTLFHKSSFCVSTSAVLRSLRCCSYFASLRRAIFCAVSLFFFVDA